MENKVEIGHKIKEQRLALNLTMDEVSQKVGITRSTLWSVENGNGNYSIDTLLKLLDFLDMSLSFDVSKAKPNRIRASRINTALDKKVNRFLIMCVEQYASSMNKSSRDVYNCMSKKGIIKELIDDYEDMHGMSTYFINEYIDKRLTGGRE